MTSDGHDTLEFQLDDDNHNTTHYNDGCYVETGIDADADADDAADDHDDGEEEE